MRGMLSPSLMCADVLNLEHELTLLDDLGVDYIHLDFMDNRFVPNITLDTGTSARAILFRCITRRVKTLTKFLAKSGAAELLRFWR